MTSPCEAMCDKARWFILARDGGHFKWGELENFDREFTTPYIEKQIKENPKGHITKWDVAQCIYELMNSEMRGD